MAAPPPSDRYARAFAAARAAGQPLVMPYLTYGYPTPADTVPLLEAIAAGGAGAIELGVPFSDPLADGPTIQRASTIALQQGATLAGALEAVRTVRARGLDLPIALMGYLNPFLAYHRPGHAPGEAGAFLALVRDAAAAGVDGFIIVDLPPEESDPYRVALAASGLYLIYLLAPTSTPSRLQAVAARASGFVYLVSVTGVTGTRRALPPDLADSVRRVRAAIDLPLAVGFGLSTRPQVESVGGLCEAAFIGSALIQAIGNAPAASRADAAQRFIEVVTGRRQGDNA